MEGGETRVRTSVEGFTGGEAAGEKNTNQSSINSNKQFPPAVTNPAQPRIRIKFLHLTMEDLVSLNMCAVR